MTDTCCICNKPAPWLYHRTVDTENGVAHFVCWRDQSRAREKHAEVTNASTN
jgi:hypothetical protein